MFRLIAAFVFLSYTAWAQGQTKVAPDCTLGASLSALGSSTVFDNRSVSQQTGVPCTIWALTWSAQSAVTSLTINIEGAPDSNGTPGSFVSLASASTFPSGKLNYSASTGYSPWMRITISAIGATGLVNAVLNGWREDQASIAGGGGGGSGCPGTTATPCVVVGPTAAGNPSSNAPVQVSYLDGSGNIIFPVFCTKAAPITLSSVSGENQIVALSGSSVIRICNIAVGMSGASTVSITAGTGTNCATSTTTLWGPYPSNTTGFTEDFFGILLAPAGDAVCLNFGSTITAGGGINYAQF